MSIPNSMYSSEVSAQETASSSSYTYLQGKSAVARHRTRKRSRVASNAIEAVTINAAIFFGIAMISYFGFGLVENISLESARQQYIHYSTHAALADQSIGDLHTAVERQGSIESIDAWATSNGYELFGDQKDSAQQAKTPNSNLTVQPSSH